MFTLFVLALPLMLVLGVLALAFGLVASVLGFVIALPFRLLGFLMHALGFVIALPFVLLAGVIVLGALALAALVGGVVLFVPLLPFVLLVVAGVWLVRRLARKPAAVRP